MLQKAITMVTINCAYTQAINPPGVKPVLTREQIWNGMERKVRRAHDFVPVFSDCKVRYEGHFERLDVRETTRLLIHHLKVIEEYGNVVIRETTVKPMEGRPGKTQEETCKLFKPVKVRKSELINNLWLTGIGRFLRANRSSLHEYDVRWARHDG